MFPRSHIKRLRRRSAARRSRAFTLAELSIVTLIISILAAVSVPRYMTALAHYRADSAARRIKVDLEFLRQAARKASASRGISFDVSAESYRIANVTDLNHAGQTDYIVKLNLTPYSASITSADCGGDAILVFNGYGKPDSSATIVVTSGSATKTITVESTTGQVTTQ